MMSFAVLSIVASMTLVIAGTVQVDASTITGTVSHSSKQLPGFNSYALVLGGSRVQVFTHRNLDQYVGNTVTVGYEGTIDSFSISSVTASGSSVELPRTGPGSMQITLLLFAAVGIAGTLTRKKKWR